MASNSRILSFHPKSYGNLKAAVRALIHAVGGEDRAAAACRVSKTTLSEYASANKPDRQMPIDVAMDLEDCAGDMSITAHMAAAHGALVLQLPPQDSEPDWLKHLAQIGKESGDVFARAGEHLADDGDITGREVETLLREVDELLMATAELRVVLAQRMADDQA